MDSVYTDFSKAFDRVDHTLLRGKLLQWGLHPIVVSWLHSFVSNRVQRVKVNEFISDQIHVSSGVPQGSHCGPILFSIFVNDIFDAIRFGDCLMFADDLKIFKAVRDPKDQIELQIDINNIFSWSLRNKLSLNIKKCQTISFYRGKSPVHYTYCIDSIQLISTRIIKDLGVTFDSTLTFNHHINDICSRSRKVLGYISRNGSDFSVNILKILYCSLLRPILEYASAIWSPYFKSSITCIEKVQNKFLRMAEYRLNIKHVVGNYSVIQQKLKLLPLQYRRIFLDLCLVYNIVNGKMASDLLRDKFKFSDSHGVREMRSTTVFVIRFRRTTSGQNSSLVRCMTEANIYINRGWLHLPLSAFKSRILSDIQMKFLYN